MFGISNVYLIANFSGSNTTSDIAHTNDDYTVLNITANSNEYCVEFILMNIFITCIGLVSKLWGRSGCTLIVSHAVITSPDSGI